MPDRSRVIPMRCGLCLCIRAAEECEAHGEALPLIKAHPHCSRCGQRMGPSESHIEPISETGLCIACQRVKTGRKEYIDDA